MVQSCAGGQTPTGHQTKGTCIQHWLYCAYSLSLPLQLCQQAVLRVQLCVPTTGTSAMANRRLYLPDREPKAQHHLATNQIPTSTAAAHLCLPRTYTQSLLVISIIFFSCVLHSWLGSHAPSLFVCSL